MVALNPAYAPIKTLERSQNRVGDFFCEAADHVGTNRLSTGNRTGENGLTVTIIVSGRSSFISRDPLGLNGGDVNLYAYVGNNTFNLNDPLGLEWYNPVSWNWDQIGSAFNFKGGGGLGLSAKVKVSKLELSAGAKVTTVGGWTNLSGDSGFYQNFRADLIRIKAGNHQVGLGATGEAKGGYRDGKAFYEETRDNVLGYKRSNTSTSSKNDWLTFGISGKALLFDFSASVDFKKIFDGITSDSKEENPTPKVPCL